MAEIEAEIEAEAPMASLRRDVLIVIARPVEENFGYQRPLGSVSKSRDRGGANASNDAFNMGGRGLCPRVSTSQAPINDVVRTARARE
jgi:hypothetical protein